MNSSHSALISIIVPVYNTEKYIKKCIESILNQTLHDLEIILIDDGSTDNSLSICQQFQKKDDRIVVLHKDNGGQSSARNMGLDYATAPFIGFVDSDDYIDKNMFNDLYTAIKEFNADIATCGVFDVFEKKTRVRTKREERYVLSYLDACKMVLEEKIDATIFPNKLFKKELFCNIRFPIGKIMEDDFTITKILLRSKRVAVLTKPYYYYIHRSNSTTTAKFRLLDLNAIEAYEENYELVKDDYPELIDVMKLRKCWARFYVLDKLYLSHEEANYRDLEKELITYLKDRKKIIFCGNFFSPIKKMGFLLLLVHPSLYKYFFNRRWGDL